MGMKAYSLHFSAYMTEPLQNSPTDLS